MNTQITGELRQADFAFQANLYEARNPTRRWLHQVRRDWVVSALERYTRPSDRVIEIGVGCGIYTRILARRCADVWAIDVNADFLVALAGVENVSSVCADATEPLPVGQAQLVLSSEVLEHVDAARSQAMLRNIAAAIHDDGFLILTTPQRFATMELAARCLRWRPMLALARRLYGTVDELGHVNLLTRGALKAQISAAGFELVEEARCGLYIPVLAELGGTAGQRVAAWVAERLDRVPLLGGLLWTQCYVLRRVPA